jgi:type 1 glutamine amidotransferase
MGGAYITHPALRPFKVSVVNKEHPITRDVQDFIVNDEQHFVTYDKDPNYILLRSENIDGLTGSDDGKDLGTKAIAGWAYDFGKGRVAFTAVGHTLHAMWEPEYFKLQKNAVRWLLKMS